MLPRRVEGGWRIGDYTYDENPRFTVPAWCERLVGHWAVMKRLAATPMGPGPAVLPGPGGYGDQPALVMDALAMFDRWAKERSDAAN